MYVMTVQLPEMEINSLKKSDSNKTIQNRFQARFLLGARAAKSCERKLTKVCIVCYVCCVSRAQWQGRCDPSPILVAIQVEVAEAVVDIRRPGNTVY